MSRLGGLLVVTLRRGLAGKNKTDLATARVLGLRRTGQSVTVPNNSSIRGQISKVSARERATLVAPSRPRSRAHALHPRSRSCATWWTWSWQSSTPRG
jgi:large subunit ribosomal protein L30